MIVCRCYPIVSYICLNIWEHFEAVEISSFNSGINLFNNRERNYLTMGKNTENIYEINRKSWKKRSKKGTKKGKNERKICCSFCPSFNFSFEHREALLSIHALSTANHELWLHHIEWLIATEWGAPVFKISSYYSIIFRNSNRYKIPHAWNLKLFVW